MGALSPQDHWEAFLNLRETQYKSLGYYLELQAELQPDHPAIVSDRGTITYGQLNRLANRTAHFFAKQGFVKGDVVALMMENRFEFIIAVTGLAKLGVIVSLINTGLRGETLVHGINLCEARAIIIGEELLPVYAGICARVRLREPATVFVESRNNDFKIPDNLHTLNPLHNLKTINPLLRNMDKSNPSTTCDITSNDILAYMYTSGNTGFRKAVPIVYKRWLGVGHRLASLGQLSPRSIQYVTLPLFLNAGFNVCLAGMLVTGSTIVLQREFSVSRFWSDMRHYKANYFVCVGEMARYLLYQEEKPDDCDNSLETVVVSGMLQDLVGPFKKRFGVSHIFEIYGTTEGVGTFVNYDEVPNMCGNLSLRGLRQGEVVKYDEECESIVLDENGHAIKCCPGESGILLAEINELNEFRGYLHDPEATEAKILRNVFEEGDQYYRTDDLMLLQNDEYISFVDRLGDTYRWKGKTVSAGAVADVTYKFFGPIEDSAAYGVRIPGYEGRAGMVALVLMEDEPMEWPKLAQHIQSRMPEHARPLFIRICESFDTSNGLTRHKKQLRAEGFDLGVVTDPIYFLHPEKNTYVPLTGALYKDIVQHHIQL